MAVAESLRGYVTVELHSVTLPQGLRAILEPLGATFRLQQGVYVIEASARGPQVPNTTGYDAMGKMTASNLGPTAATTFTYRPGGTGSTGLPLLQSVNQNGTVRNITYDAAGAMLSDGTSSYSYGARELLGANGPNVQSYMYDAFRRRVQSQLPDGRQRFSFFDRDEHLLAESSLSVASPTIAFDYVWFGDQAVAQLDTTGTHCNYADHLGTPLVQTDGNASVTWQAEHQPYGGVWSLRAGDVHQPLRMPGQTSEQFEAYIPGDEFKPGTSRGGHINLLNERSVRAQQYRDKYAAECNDDDTPPGASCAVRQPLPGVVPSNDAKNAAAGAATLVILYWVVSEGTRLFPPRNLVPIL